MKQYVQKRTTLVDSVAKSLKLYLRRHHCCYCCTAVHVTPARLILPPHSSPGGVPFPWVRTGTAAAVYSYIRTAVLCFCFFVRVIETLIVVACHVLFVTTVWISENELRESINIIIMMLISAHVRNSLRSNKFHQFIFRCCK